jgi:rubrerythrin
MILKGSRTEDVLRKALSRELHAYFNYLSVGNAARKPGMEQIAQIFFQIAKNEMEHAEQELAFIGSVDDVKENLRAAISAECSEATKYYPKAAEIAEKEALAALVSAVHIPGPFVVCKGAVMHAA